MRSSEIELKVEKTLAELHAEDSAAVEGLFAELRSQLEAERREFAAASTGSESEDDTRAKDLRDRWLSRKSGLLARIDENWLKKASKALKPAVGREFNRLRELSACVETAELAKVILAKPRAEAPSDRPGGEVRDGPAADLTLPGIERILGSLHPVNQVGREIEEIFLGLGFSLETGPEIESVYHNFDALNIPESHPSRDDWDTFYIDSNTLLRTHTSPVQIRAMQQRGAPLHILIPGLCYRRDNPDSTHSPVFHQIEGLAVDDDISFADLKGTLDFFARKFFGEKTRTSFHPSYFPFTEPSGEVSISCIFCSGEGCRVCKHSGWIEVMGCGMVHPEVLRHGGIDPQRYTGWAFGLGVERYAMLRYGINDIQLFFQSDIRFLDQF